jgi:hypothetical protein
MWSHVLLSLLSISLAVANMNVGGIPYTISNPSHHGKYSTEFTQEYFDVYSEIRTRYSEVYWTRNDPVPLPKEITDRFKDKVMAITGYEVDQVIKKDGKDVSFPTYYAYNHHYFGWLMSDEAEMIELETPKIPHELTKWTVVDKPKKHDYPTNIVFKENPGGEFRKSYHGYPKGFAQLIHSPTNFVCEPMQIDIHNREYNGPGYKPWFWPKSVINQTDPNSKLSPLIECPCTDRIGRVVLLQSAIQTSGQCQRPVTEAEECYKQVSNVVKVVSNVTVDDSSRPTGCLLIPHKDGGNLVYSAVYNAYNTTHGCGNPESLLKLSGQASSLINLDLYIDGPASNVTITMTGPDGVWFGVGFNAGVMADTPYAIIVDGFGNVTERKLKEHDPGMLLNVSVTVISNTVVAGIRKVVLERKIRGKTNNHYTFPTTPRNIRFINAIGNGPNFSYHKFRTASSLTVIPTEVLSCVCMPDNVTYLSYGGALFQYSVYCVPEPRGDMAKQNNPACKMETYHGGTHCCRHQFFLTDLDQENLIPPAVDVYYLKFRFYFEEYIPDTPQLPASHSRLIHWVFLIDADVNDYEEVKCAENTMCQGAITARLKAKDMGLEETPENYTGIMPLVIAPHCHAPSCISEELYNADTGDLICKVMAQYGTGDQAFNESGFVALHPCLFGFEPGLRTPIILSPETNLLAIKVFNNTYRHVGQMAQWTGLMIYIN